MNPKTNFIQRLLAETPPFWRKVQIVALLVLATIAELNKTGFIPENVFLLITGGAAVLAFFAQCAIKDAPILSEALSSPGVLMEHLPEFLDQISTIHKIVTDPGKAGQVLEEQGAKIVDLPRAKAAADENPETPVSKP